MSSEAWTSPQIPEFDRGWLKPTYWPIWLGFSFVWLLAYLPAGVRHSFARFAATLAFRLNPKRRHIVKVNLSLAFPQLSEKERDAMTLRHFQAMARSFLDMGLLWFSSDEKLKRQFRLAGVEHLDNARASGQEVIYHVAHVAGLEFGAVAIGSVEPAVGLYQPLKNPLVNWQILKARHRFGNRIFRRKDGFRSFVKAVRSGKALYSLTDEDFGKERSQQALFFGHPKSTLTTTARLSKMTGAAVIPLVTRYDWGAAQYVVELGEPLVELAEESCTDSKSAQLLNDSLEALIKKAPEEYMWTLKIYRSALPKGSYRPPSN